MNMKNKYLKLRDCIIATPDVRSRDYFVLTTGPKKPLYTPVTGVDSMSTLFLFHMLSRLTKSASILGCAQGERSVTNSSAVRNSPMAFFARFVSIKSAVTPNPNAKRFETYPEMIILPEAYGKNLVCTSCYASCAGDQGLQTGPGVASGPTHSLHSRD